VTNQEELKKIDDILTRTIRSMLRADGGDLEVISFENNTLKIRYQGACGGCPHAATGTLMAIQNVLRRDYDPNIVVEPV